MDPLRTALRLAARGRYRTAPNPMVGAVLVRAGEVVGRGWHRAAGAPHAEADALREAGERSAGATLYVNLEPCAHHGRTPPCADALIAAGVARVIASHRDPDPRVGGRGFARLRAAGVEVEVGARAAEAALLNFRFLVPFVVGRPAVTLKWAMSLDGKIATAAGDSRWISSPAGRRWGLALREEHAAILIGSGTALADDPRLDRRLGLAGAPNLRIVLDRRLRLGPAARLFTVPGEVLVYTEAPPDSRHDQLVRAGAQVVVLPRAGPGEVLAELQARGVQSVLVEGGAEVLAAFAACGAWDRVAVDCAPLLLGGSAAPGPLAGAGLVASLGAAERLEHVTVARRGGDFIIEGFRSGCSLELSQSVAG